MIMLNTLLLKKLLADYFTARLKQEHLASKNGIANSLKKKILIINY